MFFFFADGPDRPPRVTSSRMALTFNKPTGGFVQLKCDADGRPTPRVEWLKNSLPFKEKSRQIGKVRGRCGGGGALLGGGGVLANSATTFYARRIKYFYAFDDVL